MTLPSLSNPNRIELGCATLGGMHIGTEPTLDRMLSQVESALELGIRRFDVAPLYGNLTAEVLLGQALDALKVDRETVSINTKVGRAIVPKLKKQATQEADIWTLGSPYNLGIDAWDLTYTGILASHYGSMTRLRTERMDIALHDPADAIIGTPGLDYSGFEHTVRAMRDLREEGFAKGIGIGGKTCDEMFQMLTLYPNVFDFIILTTYNLMEHVQLLDELTPLCKAQGIELRIAGVYAGGILAGADPREPRPNGAPIVCNYHLATEAEIDRAGRLFDLAAEFGLDTLRRAAARFVTLNPDVDRIILGANTREQFEETVGYLEEPIDPALWDALKQNELIAKNAPTD